MNAFQAATKPLVASILTALSAVALAGCATTSHPSTMATLGVAGRTSALEAVMDIPGPLEVLTVHSADWSVARSGMINLDDPKAKTAHLVDGDEPIHIDFHVVKHPTRGVFLIDTGVERALRDDPDHSVVAGLVAHFMHLERLHARMPLADWLDHEHVHPAGVFLTHLHLDHITGMGDVPTDVPLYVGRNEPASRAFANVLIAKTVNRALEGHPPLSMLPFAGDADGKFEGVLDVFGDGSFWALSVPGHTAGSVAFVARTPDGPVLYVGDTCHTAWGWENDVEPGWFTADREANKKSLAALRDLVARHPKTVVHLGHQDEPMSSSPTTGRGIAASNP